ncbi:hypothetical protein Lal_00038087 [Lupinus albus]|nr:hypothetical protein Lal_00038087 [Lupinus albus]
MWYLDIDFSKHITGDKNKFPVLTPREKGLVTYGDNNKGRLLGVGRVGKPHFTTIEGIYLDSVFGTKNGDFRAFSKYVKTFQNDTCLLMKTTTLQNEEK